MDGNKFKAFSSLSSRHKRRRLSVIRNTGQNFEGTIHDPGDSSSNSDERIESEEEQIFEFIFANNPGEGAKDDVQIPHLIAESDSDAETESSNEEDTEEEPEADNVFGVNLQANDADDSVDEIENDEVFQNLADIQRRALKNVFLATNLKHVQGNQLLKTLREFPFGLICLPKDTRTLLQTPTAVASQFVQQLAGGEYLHIGFKDTLLKKIESIPANLLPEIIEVDFSTDGGKVGIDQFWPIQYRVFNIADKRPIIAGVFKGKHKPTNPFDFFEQFVLEIVQVRDAGGITAGNRVLPLRIRCFIADAPATAFALNHYGHTSSFACSKCKVEGRRCTVPGFQGAMIFEGVRHPPRTNEEYINMMDEDHHKGRCPLSPVLDPVTRVPFESMHLVWIGNCKKVVSAQVAGKHGFRRLNGRKLNIIDARMVLLKSYCPSEFNRRPREITTFHDFKATEFRQLLLYTAPAVFKDVFRHDHYQHFMILHSVMRLLISEDTPKEMYTFCQSALETYVTLSEQLYGQQFLSYNVHGLLHLVTDVELLGGMDSLSAFCYENNMTEFRKHLRKPHLPLQQYYKRLREKNDLALVPPDNNIHLQLTKKHSAGPLPENIPTHLCRQYQKLEVGGITFATSLRDSCCILTDSTICVIHNIIEMQGNTFLIVQKFQSMTAIYDVGITSDAVGVYHCTRLSGTLEAVSLNEVSTKCYRMPRWSDEEGEEENVVENEWTCVALLTPLVLPEN